MNSRPTDYESVALPTELLWHLATIFSAMEPTSGIEPETSSFVYTSPYGRTRLYISPFLETLVSRSGASATVLSGKLCIGL